MPERIQLRRTKGWRMPEGAVYVGRPTKWGNPFKIAEEGSRERAISRFRDLLLAPHDQRGVEVRADMRRKVVRYPSDEIIKAELRGRDLVCFCPLSENCHADVLLEIANR